MGRTALIWAAAGNKVDCLNALINAKAALDVQARSKAEEKRSRGLTPVPLLTSQRLAHVRQDREGKSAAIVAAENGFDEALGVLIDAKANLNLQARGRDLPTSAPKCPPRVESSEARPVSCGWQDNEGQTAAMRAAAKGHTAVIRTLVAAEADVNTLKDKSGRTAAQLATSTVVQAVMNVRPPALPSRAHSSPPRLDFSGGAHSCHQLTPSSCVPPPRDNMRSLGCSRTHRRSSHSSIRGLGGASSRACCWSPSGRGG